MASASGKWVPLEASPDIFNEWSNSLGLPESPLSFQDLFSLDEDFLSYIPQPVKAVLLLFPDANDLEAARKQEEKEAPQWEGDRVWWIKQTMGNVCGSIGLLHALMNLPEEGEYALKEDSPLVRFKKASLPLDKKERAKLLEDSDFFTDAHSTLAQAGQSAIPEDLDNVTNHFICFVAAPNARGEKRVVELDGSREGPFDRGECTSLLHDVANIVKEKYIARAGDDINFNMIVLAGERED